MPALGQDAGEQPDAEILDEIEPIQEEPEALPPVAVPEVDGPKFLVGSYVIRYAVDHPQLPAAEDILETEIELGRVPDGFVRPREGIPTERFRLGDVALMPLERYYASAIIAVTEQVVREFNRRGIIGVRVQVNPDEIFGDSILALEDYREPGQTSLSLDVHIGTVSDVRTLASGGRVATADRVNSSVHSRIRKNSPVQPLSSDAGEDAQADLVRKDLLDDYVLRLNRHPGRRVDLAVSAGERPGDVVLDYLVTENKPWYAYVQVSNTGTEETNEWRQRAGFINYQLTGNDDILAVDFITAAFDETNAFIASYDFPLPFMEKTRVKVYGNWNEFTASDIGLARENATGDGWAVGVEAVHNVARMEKWFIDAGVGVRFQNVSNTNETFDITGEEDFILPYAIVRAERNTAVSTARAALILEGQVASVDPEELENLGRIFADDKWIVLKWDTAGSIFLEPLLAPTAWEDPSTPASSTLAHELYGAFFGQYAFDYRLVPTAEQTAGGMFTVRGYDESITAADTVLIANLEYRFHLPRALGIDPDPPQVFGRSFKVAPQQVYGQPDWDLILKGFVDVGQTINSEKLSFEEDETLVGTGIGAELQLLRNVNVRLDWGYVLSDAAEQEVGDNRLHFLASLFF